jgi:hypothetical protein
MAGEWSASCFGGFRGNILPCRLYWGADKSLARPTSQCILFDGENISFDASLVIYINSTNIPPIIIINRIYEHQNLLYLYLVSFLVGLRNYQHPCTERRMCHQTGFDICRRKTALLPDGNRTRFLGSPACSVVTMHTELSRLQSYVPNYLWLKEVLDRIMHTIADPSGRAA